jgi:N6-L-threonylcarbamoyladenine synthase
MNILGIETSCDETAAAVVRDGHELLSSVVQSQIDIHKAYGGVVPEVAARSHIEVILPVVEQALQNANTGWDDIDAIGVTFAPGLIGSLLIGALTARTLAIVKQKPLYPIHHVEGHVYANFLLKKIPQFPMLALIVSGNHSQLVLFEDHGSYSLLGQTQDDAVGEAFDKVAKILGLPYPGGPSIAAAAEHGNPHTYKFPKARFTCKHKGPHGMHTRMASKAEPRNGSRRIAQYDQGVSQTLTPLTAEEACHVYDFSFSGLKTAVLRQAQTLCNKPHDFPSAGLAALLTTSQRNDIAASFQYTAVETLVDKTIRAFEEHSPASVVIAGGVAASQELRRQLTQRLPIAIDYAPPSLCTDNGAMIAALTYYQAQRQKPCDPYSLEVTPSLSM